MKNKMKYLLALVLVFTASVLAGCVVTPKDPGKESGETEQPTTRRVRTETSSAPETSPAGTEAPSPETDPSQPGERLIEASFYRGGDMNGSRYDFELGYGEDGKPFLKTERTPEYWILPIVREYDPGEDALERLEAALDGYGMRSWQDKEQNMEMIALDAATSSYRFSFQVAGDRRSRRTLYVSGEADLTDAEDAAMDAVSDLMFSMADGERLLRVYMLDDDGYEIPEGPDAEIPEETIRSMLSGYWFSEDVYENGLFVGSAEAVPEKWERVWLMNGRLEVVVNEYEEMEVRQGSLAIFPAETSWSAVTKDGLAEMTIAAGKLYLFDHDTGLVYLYGRQE